MLQNIPRGPSKAQAFGFAGGFLVATFLMIYLANVTSIQLCGCTGWLTFILTVIYGGIWFSKFSRDNQLAQQAQEQRYIEPEDGFGKRARPTTPGSGKIFLPPPLTGQQPPESV